MAWINDKGIISFGLQASGERFILDREAKRVKTACPQFREALATGKTRPGFHMIRIP